MPDMIGKGRDELLHHLLGLIEQTALLADTMTLADVASRLRAAAALTKDGRGT